MIFVWLLLNFLIVSLCAVRLKTPNTLQSIFLALLLHTISLTLVSLSLTLLGVFDWRASLGLSCLIDGVAVYFARTYLEELAIDATLEKYELAAVLFAVTFFWLFNAYFSTFYLRSGRDYGLYIIQMANIARTGGLDFSVPYHTEVLAKFGPLINYDYPGVYNLQRFGQPGKLVVQFLHMFSAFGANLFAVGGLPAALRANAFIGSLGGLGFYLFARQFLSFRFSFLLLLALFLNPTYIYNVRVTTSEVLAMMLFFSGLFFFVQSIHKPSVVVGILAGFVLAVDQFNRLDNIFLAILVFCVAFASIFSPPKIRKVSLAITISFAFVSLLGMIYSYVFSYPYVHDHLVQGLKEMWIGCLGILTLSLALPFVSTGLMETMRLGREQIGRLLKIFFIFSFVYLLKGLVYWQENEWEQSIFSRGTQELSWYTTLAILLAPFGAYYASKKHFITLFPFAVLTLFSTILFTYNPAISADHFWATRRWMWGIIPGLLFLIFYFLEDFRARNKQFRGYQISKILPILVLVLYFGQSFYIYRKFLFVPFLQDMHVGLSKLADDFHKQDKIKYFIGGAGDIAGMLTYVYNVPTYRVEPGKSIQRKIEAGALSGQYQINYRNLYEYLPSDAYAEACGLYYDVKTSRLPNRLKKVCFDLTYGPMPEPNQAIPSEVDLPVRNSYFSCRHEKLCDFAPELGKVTARSDSRNNVLEFSKAFIRPGKYRFEILGKVLDGEGQVMFWTAVNDHIEKLQLAPRPESGVLYSGVIEVDSEFKFVFGFDLLSGANLEIHRIKLKKLL